MIIRYLLLCLLIVFSGACASTSGDDVQQITIRGQVDMSAGDYRAP